MKFWQVDSFTKNIFSGNPAAVFVLHDVLSDEVQSKIAQEMNLAETAFVLIKGDQLNIRWFTPSTEVDLCGHATLAAAHVLWEQNFVKSNVISFTSRSGLLGVTRQNDLYTLDFPKQSSVAKLEYKAKISEIIGVLPVYVGSNGHDCLVVVDGADFVKNAQPDLAKIKELKERGLLLTARAHTSDTDYVYRAFFPALDIPEDPVTGSANTGLAPYWAEILGKNKLSAYQASQRGGHLQLEVTPERVLISGHVVTVFEANLHLNC